ncbi:hypothetical protein CKO25_11465 [Thiocapsa imhoffii]|uniref:Uncharacterized protein n=1 Tax=Thiocapsa imhoffii TaxID=382777 RepID=A0A9X0WJ55_9GAMM|nr:hypothetical protein [Thiocapsa imhoffii]MBK1645249.1 hypothetical protein [Thiocapsa imhoffii]
MSNTVEISLEAVLDTANMERAWAGVKANAGSGGVDGKGIAETEAHLKCHWPVIREKLLRGDYRPAAVRAVDIAKPGGGTRRLGIPTFIVNPTDAQPAFGMGHHHPSIPPAQRATR